jgi:hypothetical protein
MEIVNWRGVSGKSYSYSIHKLPVSFNKLREGNYIYTKLINDIWVPIYIGQGDLGDRISPNHHQAKCIVLKGATHVHVHLNSDENARVAEEQDLLQAHSDAHKPFGCNEKEGG